MTEWYYLDEFRQPQGPCDAWRVAQLAAGGDLLVCSSPMTTWVSARSLPEIDALASGEEKSRAGYYDSERIARRNLDELIGACRGMLTDGKLTDDEIVAIHEFIETHPGVLTEWPAYVLWDRLGAVLEDAQVDENERAELVGVIRQMLGAAGDVPVPMAEQLPTQLPLDDPPPDVRFRDRLFSVTGRFVYGTRRRVEDAIADRGGGCLDYVRQDTDYLVIGTIGTNAWLHSTHGTKIKKAVRLREQGSKPRIICERHWVQFLE
jgi:hypothetical protein